MKKGFIERIENNNVYVVFEDETQIFDISSFSDPIKLDMIVTIDNDKIITEDPPKQLKEKIDKITGEIFTTFSPKRRKK